MNNEYWILKIEDTVKMILEMKVNFFWELKRDEKIWRKRNIWIEMKVKKRKINILKGKVFFWKIVLKIKEDKVKFWRKKYYTIILNKFKF